ncbi:hypothetical protein F2Q68_00026538 [Brassica cretica]|uniref:Uncharacterized protein n=1 Tax=Brassica cretica TaxID=69181 RepID=A0A8S9I6M2_BRACR|nr:hypothetical protein F2Q68_00026538 [Brassica cretica]
MFLGAALGGSLDSSPLQRSSGSSGGQLDVGALAHYESEFPLAKSAFGDIQKVYRISILSLSFTAVFALEDLSTSEACCKPGFRRMLEPAVVALFLAILGIVLSRVHRSCFFSTVGIVPPVPLFNSKTNFTSVLEGSGWRGVRIPPLVAQSTSGTSQCCDFVHGSVAWLCFAGLEHSVSFSSDHSIPVSCFSVLDQRSSAVPSF